tara:strand:+ start:101 stop:259 length:159 start_codon:yes stop_codon:yes gene_type:complete
MEAEMIIVLENEATRLFAELKDMLFKYGKFDIETIRKRREWRLVATTLKQIK